MPTVKEVITDALEELNYIAAEEPVEAADGNTAMRYLNDMLTMWAAKGINLGYTLVSNLGQEVTVPYGSVYGIKKLLAISLSNKFKITITQTLMDEAEKGWEAILLLTTTINPVQYPSILPRGSGNYRQYVQEDTFYLPLSEAIYNETSGFIATEDSTEVS